MEADSCKAECRENTTKGMHASCNDRFVVVIYCSWGLVCFCFVRLLEFIMIYVNFI
jgi:hypothetical protein